MSYFYIQGSTSKDLLDILLGIVSPMVLIILFGFERYYSSQQKRKDIKLSDDKNQKDVERTWYLEVLVRPIIGILSSFYRNTSDAFEEQVEELELLRKEDTPVNNYNTEIAKMCGKFAGEKRKIELEVIAPINALYPIVGEELTECLHELEDLYTTGLDSKNSQLAIDQFKNSLPTNKTILLRHLYTPLKVDKAT